MPTYQFEAMDSTGAEIKDVIDAASQEEAQATIRQMGYFVTKIAVKKQKKAAAEKAKTGRKRGFAFVSFMSEDAAKAALEVLGSLAVRGRPCTVHLAHPRGERPPPRGRALGAARRGQGRHA